MVGTPNSLLVWHSQQEFTGLGMQVSNPWSLPTVASFMSAKYAQEKQVLCQAALNSYLKKRMTYEQLCTALELCPRMGPAVALQPDLDEQLCQTERRHTLADLPGLVRRGPAGQRSRHPLGA